MDERERAKEIAHCIQTELQRTTEPQVLVPISPEDLATQQIAPRSARFIVTRETGCLSCDPGSCTECGFLFSGERIIIVHVTNVTLLVDSNDEAATTGAVGADRCSFADAFVQRDDNVRGG